MATVLQVLDWVKHFESYKSKNFKACTHLYVPNKQTGMGFTFILDLPDGAAILGIWYLIAEALSLQPLPRQGYLTDTGGILGRPWTDTTLARRWRRKPEEIQRALEVLTSEDVGWIQVIDASTGARIPQGYHKDTARIPQAPSDLDLDLSNLDLKTKTLKQDSPPTPPRGLCRNESNFPPVAGPLKPGHLPMTPSAQPGTGGITLPPASPAVTAPLGATGTQPGGTSKGLDAKGTPLYPSVGAPLPLVSSLFESPGASGTSVTAPQSVPPVAPGIESDPAGQDHRPNGAGEDAATAQLQVATCSHQSAGQPVTPPKKRNAMRAGSGGNGHEPKPLELPAALEQYRGEIDAWIAYHREIGKPYKPRGINALFAKMQTFGPRLPEAIQNSMANNYQGLFDGSGSCAPRQAQSNRPRAMSVAEARADRERIEAGGKF